MPEPVGDARDERRLRPDHDEVGRDRPRQVEQAVAVVGTHRMAVAERRDPGIAGRRVERGERRALRESRHASACSRAPDPTSSTLTRASLVAAGGGPPAETIAA